MDEVDLGLRQPTAFTDHLQNSSRAMGYAQYCCVNQRGAKNDLPEVNTRGCQRHAGDVSSLDLDRQVLAPERQNKPVTARSQNAALATVV